MIYIYIYIYVYSSPPQAYLGPTWRGGGGITYQVWCWMRSKTCSENTENFGILCFRMKKIIEYSNPMKIYQQQVSMIIDTFKRGIKHKRWFDSHCKTYCRDPDITLKAVNKNCRYVTVSPHKNTYANFLLETILHLKR